MSDPCREQYRGTVWRNRETGLYLTQHVTHTHTGNHENFGETTKLIEASVVVIPHYHIRCSGKYEPVEVDITRTVRLKQ